jgi:dTDP-4-dehydrorhamnose 3,5-epimerase-like enzyme
MKRVQMAQVIDLPTHSDERGRLTVIDGTLPFAIARVYYMYAGTGKPRGGHRHYKTSQALVCTTGTCVVDWTNGRDKGSVSLDRPDKMLLVPPEDWHIMRDFTAGAVLLVLASQPFDALDYIDEAYGE